MRDVLRREQLQKNEQQKKLKNVNWNITKQINKVTKKKKVLPQSTFMKEVLRAQQALSDAENKIMRRSSLNQNNNLIDNNQHLEKEPAQIQLSAEQLCKANDALLGQFELIPQQPSTGSMTTECSLSEGNDAWWTQWVF